MPRREKVQEAIQAIRDFYDLGRQVAPKQPLKESYGQKLIENDACMWQETTANVQKARECADPEYGYTRQELNELCRLIRAVQPHQDDGKAIFGKSHLIRLLSVRPKRRRRAFQREAIEHGWSYAMLEAEIAKRFGTRRHGGRKRRLPGDVPGLLAQLEKMCESWRRWAEAFKAREKDAEAMPKQLQKQIDNATGELAKLHDLTVNELQALYPERETRPLAPQTPAKRASSSRRKKWKDPFRQLGI